MFLPGVIIQTNSSLKRWLFGVNEKLLTQHISGPVTKYKLLYVSSQGWARGLG